MTSQGIMKPIEAAQDQLKQVREGQVNTKSFARVAFSEGIEQGYNEAINLEISLAHTYLSMSSYFDRDNVALVGIANYWREKAMARYEAADRVIGEQNKRGGKVKLQAIPGPQDDFWNEEEGDALYSFNIALALERMKYERYNKLHEVTEDAKDGQSSDFLEELLSALVKEIKELGFYTSELKRVGRGHGTFHFDERLQAGSYA